MPIHHWTAPIAAILFALLAIPLQASNVKTVAGVTLTERAQWYVELRESLRGGEADPGVSRSPEQIEAERKALVKAVQQSLPDVEPGWLIPEPSRELMQSALDVLMDSANGDKLADTVLGEGNPTTEGERVKIKPLVPYPSDAPVSSMPPEIIEGLIALPESLQYRFVSRHLVILDTVSELILDYVAYAVPPTKAAPVEPKL